MPQTTRQLTPRQAEQERRERTCAQQLNIACKEGQLAGAYRLIAPLTIDVQCRVMLHAGFSTTGPKDRTAAKYHQQQIAQACNAKVDGWHLQRAA